MPPTHASAASRVADVSPTRAEPASGRVECSARLPS
jgi:hypothetical protein